jgi:uncharacterized YccA/Bax inhibitor family protein
MLVKKKETLLMLLLIFALDAFVFALSPGLIDYFWYIQGLLGGFVLLYLMAFRARIPRSQIKYFTPLASGMVLMLLSLILMRMDFILGLLGVFLGIVGVALLLFGFYYLRKVKVSDK